MESKFDIIPEIMRLFIALCKLKADRDTVITFTPAKIVVKIGDTTFTYDTDVVAATLAFYPKSQEVWGDMDWYNAWAEERNSLNID